jgi:glycine/D-amino acid oxidase-like deaminating enzyme
MNTDYLLVGQGIAGCFLQHYLEKAGFSTHVIDQSKENTPSKVAAGIINPVTGRRLVTTWMIEEVLPFAVEAYAALQKKLGVTTIRPKNIVDFFTTPQMRGAFEKRYQVDATYLETPSDENHWNPFFNYHFGAGILQPCFLVDLRAILQAQRNYLESQHKLTDQEFKLEELKINAEGVQYGDLHAKKIIFCDGISSCNHPYFSSLPFAPNKGEALWVEIEGLPDDYIFKKGLNLVPWEKNIYWVGSTYKWNFSDDRPTQSFLENTKAQLNAWLKLPFKVLDHRASVRPATLERRPFVGFHPLYPQIGLFNGMGTKGCSLSPYLANAWVESLQTGAPMIAEADLARFKNLLSKNS